jgi:hypothetical protein
MLRKLLLRTKAWLENGAPKMLLLLLPPKSPGEPNGVLGVPNCSGGRVGFFTTLLRGVPVTGGNELRLEGVPGIS